MDKTGKESENGAKEKSKDGSGEKLKGHFTMRLELTSFEMFLTSFHLAWNSIFNNI